MSNSQDANNSGYQNPNSALLNPGLWSPVATAGSMSPQVSTCGTSTPQSTPTRVHQHPFHEHPVCQNHPGSSERHMIAQYIQHYHARIDKVTPARKDPGCGSYSQAAGNGSTQK